MSGLRDGRANTARGAARFLCEMVGRVRYSGTRGQLTVWADSGFYSELHTKVTREQVHPFRKSDTNQVQGFRIALSLLTCPTAC